MNMKFLDCTLRDGGYYTNWDFNQELVDIYLQSIELLPVDIIEVGYRSIVKNGYLGQYYYCPKETLAHIKKLAPSKKIAIMFNEVDITPEDCRRLLKPISHLVDIVRMAVKPERFEQAVNLSRCIKEQGFEVGFNLMYMSRIVKNPSILNELPKLNGIVDYFSFVDSYGGIFPKDVKDTLKKVNNVLDMKIGFHGHNNLELAFINALTAMDNGCSIVDGTITGMGRGAGNLKTELYLTWLSSHKGVDVNFNALSEVVSVFEKMQAQYGWGTNLPYMVSGVSSLPQQEVMDWVTKRTYSMNSIVRALQNQNAGDLDNAKLPLLNGNENFKKAILIAGGPSAIKHSSAIHKWIEINKKNIIVIHVSSRHVKHYEGVDAPQIYCLVGNEGHRLEQTFDNLKAVNGRCILPPYPRKMGTYVPESMMKETFELKEVNFTDKYNDSHTAISLQTALELGVEEIYSVGFDGYNGEMIGEKEKDLLKENSYLFERFSKKQIIRSLTQTQYNELEAGSVYSLVANNLNYEV
ncbi:MAG: aldolase catalytic domain-containing protein [Candidatus Babeliales bacterium]